MITSVPPTEPPPAALLTIPEDDAKYEYKDNVDLDEDAPEVDKDDGPLWPPRKRLQTARINPATLAMLSGALYLLTSVAPPADP